LPDTPTILQIGRSATGLSVEVFPLAEAEPMASAARPPTFDDPQDVLARARAALDRIQQACEAHRPNLTDGGLANTPERYWYLAIVDHLKAIRAYANGISEDLLARHDNLAPPMLPPKKPRSKRQKFAGYHRPRHLLKALYTAQDLVEFVRQLAAENAAESVKRKTEDRIETLLEQLAIAELFSPCESGWPRERVLALIRHLSGLRSGVSGLTKRLMHKFRFFFAEDINQIDFVAEFGLDATLWRGTKSPEWSSTGPNIGQPARTEEPLWWDLITDDVVRTAYCHRYFLELIMFEGPCAHRLLQPEQGTHLVVTPDGRIEPIQLLVLPLGAEGSVEHSLVDCLAEHERCRHAARSRQSDANADPLGWKPTVAIYRLNQGDHIEMVADLRAGLQSSRGDLGRPAILLPLPPEFGV
jgi:hypothetical protein